MDDFNSRNSGFKKATSASMVREERTAAIDKVRESQRVNRETILKKMEAKAATATASSSKASSGTLGEMLSFSKKNRIVDESLRGKEDLKEVKKHKEIVKNLKGVSNSIDDLKGFLKGILLLNVAGRFLSGRGMFGPAVIGGGRGKGGRNTKGSTTVASGNRAKGSKKPRYRHPKTQRFISEEQARKLGLIKSEPNIAKNKGGARAGNLLKGGALAGGFLGGPATLLGGAIGASSIGVINNNRDKDFTEGGLNSRATGYLGAALSGGILGASTLGPIGAAVGIATGLTTAIYTDYKEEVDTYVSKKWKESKVLFAVAGEKLKFANNKVKEFAGDTLFKVASVVSAAIPAKDALLALFDGNPFMNIGEQLKAFISSSLSSVGTTIENAIPAAKMLAEWKIDQLKDESVAHVEKARNSVQGFMDSIWNASLTGFHHKDLGKDFVNKIRRNKAEPALMRGSIINSEEHELRAAQKFTSERVEELKKRERKARRQKTKDKVRKELDEYSEILNLLNKEVNIRSGPTRGVLNPDTGLDRGHYTTESTIFSKNQMIPVSPEENKAKAALYTNASEMAKYRMEAARITGVDYGYLMNIAARESKFDTTARPKNSNFDKTKPEGPGNRRYTSSAVGLDQFVNETWNTMVKRYGKSHGLKKDGRTDPLQSSIAAGLLAKENINALKGSLKRDPTQTEAYLSHVLGSGQAIRFLKNMKADPSAIPAKVMEAEASSNPWVFYKKGDKNNPRNYAEVMDYFAKGTKGSVGVSSAYSEAFRELFPQDQRPLPMSRAKLTNISASTNKPNSFNNLTKGVLNTEQGSNIKENSAIRPSPQQEAHAAVANYLKSQADKRDPFEVTKADKVDKTPKTQMTHAGNVNYVMDTDGGLLILNTKGIG